MKTSHQSPGTRTHTVILLMLTVLLAPACSDDPSPGSPAAAVKERRDNYRRIGEAYKQIKETIESGAPDAALVHRNTALIRNVAALQPALFPAGSGQGSGATTRARDAVWSEPAMFAQRQRDFLAAADALLASGPETLSVRYEALTQACLDCHQDFRERR
jgi:cytochrome c556